LQAPRKLGIPEAGPADEPELVRVERIVRGELEKDDLITAYGMAGLVSVETSAGDTLQLMVDRGEGKWRRFQIGRHMSDEEVRNAIRAAIATLE
jgi:hypothetical protein